MATISPAALRINSGTLQVGNNDTGGNLPAGSVEVDSSLTYEHTDNINVLYSICGNGTFTQNGSGIVTLECGQPALRRQHVRHPGNVADWPIQMHWARP